MRDECAAELLLLIRTDVSPRDFFPIASSADGSCLPHVVSRYVCSHEDHHEEMQVQMIIKGMIN